MVVLTIGIRKNSPLAQKIKLSVSTHSKATSFYFSISTKDAIDKIYSIKDELIIICDFRFYPKEYEIYDLINNLIFSIAEPVNNILLINILGHDDMKLLNYHKIKNIYAHLHTVFCNNCDLLGLLDDEFNKHNNYSDYFKVSKKIN